MRASEERGSPPRAFTRLFYRLAAQLETEEYLTHFQIKNGNGLTLQGELQDQDSLIERLAELPFLDEVKSGHGITGRTQEGRRRFMIKATILDEAL